MSNDEKVPNRKLLDASAKASFVGGSRILMDVISRLNEHEETREIAEEVAAGFALLTEAYRKRLKQLLAHYDTTEELVEHARRWLPRHIFPGDMRVKEADEELGT